MKKILILLLATVLFAHFEMGQANPVQDTITISGIQSGDTAKVVIDGKKVGGCENDLTFIVTNNRPVVVGNFVAADTCNKELFVFSKGKGVILKKVNWENITNLDLEFQPLATIEVNFWIPQGARSAGISWEQLVKTYKARANELFMNFGFGFQIHPIIMKNNVYESLISKFKIACSNALFDTLKGSGFYNENIINVYLVDSIPGQKDARGFNCSGNKANIIFLNKNTLTVETLAHEIGHAFSLSHSNRGKTPSTGFTIKNIMNGDGEIRTLFHVGQAFHANFNSNSFFEKYFPSSNFRQCTGDGNHLKCPRQAFNF